MKRFVKSATNSSNIPANPSVDKVLAADDTLEDTLDDKIDVISDNFDYIIDGINQLDSVEGDEILNDLNEYLNGLISKIAEKLV